MSTATDTKCSKCGRWQIKLSYCPYCGNKHSRDGYYPSPEDEGENKIYVYEIKDAEYPPIVRFKENK